MKESDFIEDIQYVVFTLNKQFYSFSIKEVVEILRVPMITSIPGINEIIEGVINLRGNIIPIVNLHKRFHLPIPKKSKKNRIVIVQGKSENIGLIVEEVKMVTQFDENNVEPTSGETLEKALFNCFAKLNGQVVGVLNLEKVLYDY